MSCFLGLNPNKFTLAIMHAKNTSDTWAIFVTIKDSSRQNLHEGICHVLHKSNLLHSHISSQYYLTYQMILSLNMVIFGWFLSSLNRVTTPLLSQNSIGVTEPRVLPQVPLGTYEAKQLPLILQKQQHTQLS